MIITIANMYYIGTYADVDTDESDYDAENLTPLIGASATNNDVLELVAIENNDNNNNGIIGDNDVFGANTAGDFVDYTLDGTAYTNVEADTSMVGTVTVTYGDGTTSSLQVLIVQMDNGQTFVCNLNSDSSAGLLDNVNIQSITITAITNHDYNGYFTNQSVINGGVVCFTRGVEIATQQGLRKVEDLSVGDMVLTRDNGYRSIRWVGNKKVPAYGDLAPVQFEAGAIGNPRAITVSPQHRILVANPLCELLFGENEVLIPAIYLLDWPGVSLMRGGEVEYFHILFDQHEIIIGNDCWSESFHPGDTARKILSTKARQEVLTLFPELETVESSPAHQLARRALRKYEAVVLLNEMQKTNQPVSFAA